MSPLFQQHRPCPLCDRDNSSEPVSLYSRPPWRLKTCGSCRFVYLENPPAYEELKETLSWAATHKQEKVRRLADEPWLHYLDQKWIHFRRKYFPRRKLTALIEQYVLPGKVCDVGCGSGRHLILPDDRYIPYGVEICGSLAEQASLAMARRGGLVLNTNALAAMHELPQEEFTGIVMRAYLEHEVQPKPVLAAAHRILKRHGHLIIKVPNFGSLNRRVRGKRWCGFRLPDHVNYFTPSSLRMILEQSGLTVVRMSPLDRPLLGDNMWAVAAKLE